MSDAALAVETPTISLPQQYDQASDSKPKKQPPYAVIVINDNIHTFQYVTETFTKVFGYPLEKSFALAQQIHNAGKGIVWSGVLEVAELKCEQLRAAGHDFYGPRVVKCPLNVIVEPLPG
jgi:ATP-dependent Clp protease adaptor protein ClpS